MFGCKLIHITYVYTMYYNLTITNTPYTQVIKYRMVYLVR